MKKFVKILSGSLAAAAVLSLSMTGCSGNKGVTVSGKDSCEITVEGMDGKGTIELDLDDDKIDEIALALYGDPDSIPLDKYTEYLSAYSKFTSAVYSIDYSIVSDKKEDFSNGDVVKIKMDCNEEKMQEVGINLTDTEFEYTVEGLKEATSIDPFDGLKVEFTGISPNIKVEFDTSDCDSYVRNNVNFYVDGDNGDFANGEKFTVTASYNEYKAEQNSIIFTNSSKEYTVEGALEYPATLDGVDLTTIDTQFNDMLEAAMSDKKVYVGGKVNPTNSWSAEFEVTKVEPKIVFKAYLNAKNTVSYFRYNNKYDCFWEISVTAKCTDKGYGDDYKVGQTINYKQYYVAGIENIPVDENKKIPDEYLNDYDEEFYSDKDTTYQEIYNEWITANKADYNITEMQVGNSNTSSEAPVESSADAPAESSVEPAVEESSKTSAEESSKVSAQ